MAASAADGGRDGSRALVLLASAPRRKPRACRPCWPLLVVSTLPMGSKDRKTADGEVRSDQKRSEGEEGCERGVRRSVGASTSLPPSWLPSTQTWIWLITVPEYQISPTQREGNIWSSVRFEPQHKEEDFSGYAFFLCLSVTTTPCCVRDAAS